MSTTSIGPEQGPPDAGQAAPGLPPPKEADDRSAAGSEDPGASLDQVTELPDQPKKPDVPDAAAR